MIFTAEINLVVLYPGIQNKLHKSMHVDDSSSCLLFSNLSSKLD